jgi:hypothetical protein
MLWCNKRRNKDSTGMQFMKASKNQLLIGIQSLRSRKIQDKIIKITNSLIGTLCMTMLKLKTLYKTMMTLFNLLNKKTKKLLNSKTHLCLLLMKTNQIKKSLKRIQTLCKTTMNQKLTKMKCKILIT